MLAPPSGPDDAWPTRRVPPQAASGAVSSLSSSIAVDSVLSGVITSSSLGGAFLGTAVTFLVGQPLGRRRELLLGAALYTAGSLLTIFAPNGAIVGCVIGGRVVYGLGIAFSMHAAPVYISETAPARMRGKLVSLKEAFIVGGILLGFGVGMPPPLERPGKGRGETAPQPRLTPCSPLVA